MDKSELPEGFRPGDPTAGDKAHTDHADVAFVLKEHGDGTPWVLVEPRGPTLPVLERGDGFLGLTFRDDVSFEEAQRFVQEMRKKLRGVSYTKFTT